MGKFIQVTGLQEAKQKLRKVRNLLHSPDAQRAMAKIKGSAKSYWKGNVYNYYNTRISRGLPTSGQLGNAAIVHQGPGFSLDVAMRPMYHVTAKGNIYEYSQFLQRDVLPSLGMYVYALDCRVRTGVHPGASNLFGKWNPWMANFNGYVAPQVSAAVSELVHKVVNS